MVKTFSQGIHIREESYLASGAIMFSHGYARDIKSHTYLSKRCFVGTNAIIMPGIKIGDEVIIGSGSIVIKDVPSNSIVAGNSARIIKTGIQTTKFGQIKNAV